ncbi:MAG: hypothetical protein JKY23_00525 [Nitrospinaceae bacterium]|nr:hypothetical protein [Nitrospinaceae bacterium]
MSPETAGVVAESLDEEDSAGTRRQRHTQILTNRNDRRITSTTTYHEIVHLVGTHACPVRQCCTHAQPVRSSCSSAFRSPRPKSTGVAENSMHRHLYLFVS